MSNLGTRPNVRTRVGLCLLAAGLLILILGYQQLNIGLSPVNRSNHEYIRVVVPERSSTARVGQILEERGLIRSQSVFRLYCRLGGYASSLKAGTYSLSPSMSTREIVACLVEGREERIRVTIPEGFTLAQIARVMEERGVCPAADFMKAASREYPFPFLKEIPRSERYLEGYLFPDTYYVSPGATPDQVIMMMLSRFAEVKRERIEPLLDKAPVSDLNKLVIVASMVESETAFDEERPLVAGVIYNRLAKHMPLQVDATVQYALGYHKTTVTYKDLKVESPYNTYRVAGLPPGPISSPGLPSLMAALQPAHHDYYYYVATRDGHHLFAHTYAEHLKNKARVSQ